MKRTWKVLSLLLSMSFTLIAWAPAHARDTADELSSDPPEASAEKQKQETEVRQVLIDLAAAINSGDAKRAAAFWSEHAVYFDAAGADTRGRAAIESRLATGFAHRSASSADSKVELHPERFSLGSPTSAVVLGTVSRNDGSLDLPAANFALSLVKENNGWLIHQAKETAIQQPSAADHLKALEWLIGKWQVENQVSDSAPTLEVSWGASRNFIVSKCITSSNGTQQTDSQVIGWDPRTQSIVSWHFDCDGGFGYGKWRKDPEKHWLVDYAGIAANGKPTVAKNIFTETSADQFTWQSTGQSADGVPIPDTATLKLTRANP